jgi:hypothetical protein
MVTLVELGAQTGNNSSMKQEVKIWNNAGIAATFAIGWPWLTYGCAKSPSAADLFGISYASGVGLSHTNYSLEMASES